jgi:hypothetical protein
MKIRARVLFVFIALMQIAGLSAQSTRGKSDLVFISADIEDSRHQLFSIYIDGVRYCGLPNNNYITVSVDTGEHSFFANKSTRKKIKKQWEGSALSLNLEAGKTYYMNLVINNEARAGVSLTPILESSAKQLMASCTKLQDKK